MFSMLLSAAASAAFLAASFAAPRPVIVRISLLSSVMHTIRITRPMNTTARPMMATVRPYKITFISTPPYSGMLPCFLAGLASRLPESISSADARIWRVWAGSITSST